MELMRGRSHCRPCLLLLASLHQSECAASDGGAPASAAVLSPSSSSCLLDNKLTPPQCLPDP